MRKATFVSSRRFAVAAFAATIAVVTPAGAVNLSAPAALTPETLKLPSGPGAIHGLADNARVGVFSGQVEYAVPIDVPADRGGVKPALSFTYSGELGNGPLGVGWSIGAAFIRRGLRNGLPRYTADDELELVGLGPGGRIVSIGPGEYRLEGQGQSYRIVMQGSGYRLYDPQGTQYLFGTDAAARQADGGRIATWWLQQIVAVNGATVSYQYKLDGGQLYPLTVTWGPTQAFSVNFDYSPRLDQSVSFKTAFKVQTALLLNSVKVYAFGELLRTYALDYDGSFALARLGKIHESGRGGKDALPDLTFTYARPDVPRLTPLANTEGWSLGDPRFELLDVDSDGLVDLVWIEDGRHAFKRNRGGAFADAVPVTEGAGLDAHKVRFVDLDGDGRAELVLPFNETWLPYHLAGRQWTSGNPYPGADGSVGLPDSTTHRLVNLNGDGRIDVLDTNGSGLFVKLNGANGFAEWSNAPDIAGYVPLDRSTTLVDVNGDGLADAITVVSNSYFVYLGRGDGTFEPWRQSVPLPPGADGLDAANRRFIDLNRDGLVDLVLFSGGNVSWYPGHSDGTFAADPISLPRPDGAGDGDVVVSFGDLNGNGSEDVVWSSPDGMWILDLAGATSAGMLTGIDNGLGKSITISYAASTQLALAAENAGAPWHNLLPFSMPVAVKMVVTVGPDEPSRATEWQLRDGFWDYAERRMGGFLVAREHGGGAVAATVETQFEPGTGRRRELRGQPLSARTFDEKGQPLLSHSYSRDTVAIAGLGSSALLRVPVLRAETDEHYEGALHPIVVRTEYSLDNLGRVIEERKLGRIDVTGDESTRFYTYASDDTTWVRDKVVTEGTKDAAGIVLRTTRHFYGDDRTMLAAGQIGKGWLRRTEALLHDATRGDVWRDDAELRYDAGGNVVAHFDGTAWRYRGYDATGLFAVDEHLITGGRTLAWTATWDRVQGLQTSLTGPNGETVWVTYDGLGRPQSRARQPGLPFELYQYDWTAPRPRTTTYSFGGAAAALTQFSGWAPGSGWRQVVEVANGAGEHRLTATRLEPAKWLVAGYGVHDERGKIVFHAEPFEWAGSNPPTAAPADAAGTHLSYDAIGRTVEERNPTGATRRSQFTAFSVVTTSDGLAPVTSRQDGLGRVIHTERLVNGTVESVDASYDATSAITRLSLQNGAVLHGYSYDSLGRLVGASDPDSGVRTLRYNDLGELVQQVNGAGQVVNYEYDDIGRVTAMRTADNRAFVYHYDVGKDGTTSRALGKIAWIEEPTGEVQLGYDGDGRLATTRRIVKGRSLEERREFGAVGHLMRVAFDDGVEYDLGYDDAGRLSRVGDYWTALQLDPHGPVKQERFGNGVVASIDRDAGGQATHLRIERPAGGALYDVSAQRNAFGAITSLQDSDGIGLDHSASFGYDGAGRLRQATIGGAARQFQFGYAYDGLQNLISRGATGPKSIGTFPGTYVYGEGGRSPRQLTRVQSAAGDVVMAYDAAGRMTRQGDASLVYDEFDELVQVLDAAGLPKATHDYGYDGLRTWTRNSDGSEQIWLAPHVTEKGGQREHTIDAEGRTVAKLSIALADLPPPATGALGVVASPAGTWRIGRTLRVALAPSSALALLLALVATRRRRRPRGRRAPAYALAALAAVAGACGAHGPVGQQRAAATVSGERVYFHQGFAAGPTLFTRSDASVEEERTYEPFGAAIDAYRETGGNGAVGEADFTLESRNELDSETDPNTSWTYQGARWMAPQLARWLSPDAPTKAPEPKFLLAPWDLNPYAYARANPIIFWDPDGQNWKTFTQGFGHGGASALVATLEIGAAALVAPEALVVFGGYMLAKAAYHAYQARHEIVAVGQKVLSHTTTDAEDRAIGEVLGNFLVGIISGRVAGKFLKAAPEAAKVVENTEGGCFVAGTTIATARGAVPIEDVVDGDEVWARDVETGAEGWRSVVRTVVHDREPLASIGIRNERAGEETIEATLNHPFWVEGRGWTAAASLAPSDRVAQSGGHVGVVTAVLAEAAPARVFNFEVEGWHTYFVGDEQTLVHNSPECLHPPEPTTARATRREAMRQAGIPTSTQPVGQQSPRVRGTNQPAGRQYTYEVPAEGGGTRTMSVQHSLTDRVEGHGAHWEAGAVKPNGQVDSVGRPRLTSDKIKIDE